MTSKKRVYIFGICGVFMASLARIARQRGYEVSGFDAHAHPPMSDMLRKDGISFDSKSPKVLPEGYDMYIIGNIFKRGDHLLEAAIDSGKYISGPQWLHDHCLVDKKVIVIAGTHGKTTTTSMLAWIFSRILPETSYLIGGDSRTPEKSSYYNPDGEYFIIEGDEYFTAPFDNRPKFYHYSPYIFLLKNLELDHVDIYPSLDTLMIEMQRFLKTMPSQANILLPQHLASTLCTYSHTHILAPDTVFQQNGSEVKITINQTSIKYHTDLRGLFFLRNMTDAVQVALLCDLDPDKIAQALQSFQTVVRRMDILHESPYIIEDFGHHPTTIEGSLRIARDMFPKLRIIAITSLSTNSLRSGVFHDRLFQALKLADAVGMIHSDNAAALDIFREHACFGSFFTPQEFENFLSQINYNIENDLIIFMTNKDILPYKSYLIDKIS